MAKQVTSFAFRCARESIMKNKSRQKVEHVFTQQSRKTFGFLMFLFNTEKKTSLDSYIHKVWRRIWECCRPGSCTACCSRSLSMVLSMVRTPGRTHSWMDACNCCGAWMPIDPWPRIRGLNTLCRISWKTYRSQTIARTCTTWMFHEFRLSF